MRDNRHLDLRGRRHAVGQPAKIAALIRPPYSDGNSKRVSAKTGCVLRRGDQLTNPIISREHAGLDDQARLPGIAPQLLSCTWLHRYRIRSSCHDAVKCLRKVVQSTGTNIAVADEVVDSDAEQPPDG